MTVTMNEAMVKEAYGDGSCEKDEEDGSAKIVTCDATGMKTTVFSDGECKNQQAVVNMEWGKCISLGPVTMKMTGAEYAKAAIGSLALGLAAYIN